MNLVEVEVIVTSSLNEPLALSEAVLSVFWVWYNLIAGRTVI